MSHAPFIEKIDKDKIIVIWFAGSGEWSMDANILVTVYLLYTHKWESITTLISEIGHSVGNAVIITDQIDQLQLWYVRTTRGWDEGEIVHKVSMDSGISWSPSKILPLPKGWLIRGRPIIAGNKIYLPVYDENSLTSAIWEQDICKNSGSLSETISATGGLIHPALVPYKKNEFRCFFRNPWQPNRMHYAYSMDKGRTWSRPYQTELPNPNSGIDVLLLEKDRLLCVYNHSEINRYPLSMAISKDLGRTWYRIFDIENEPEEFSYPSLLQTQNSVYLAYTYKRRAIKFIELEKKTLLKAF